MRWDSSWNGGVDLQRWLRTREAHLGNGMHLKSPGASRGLLSDILEIFLRRLWDYVRTAVPPVFKGLVIFILGLAVGVCEHPAFEAFF
jgi:hypothetical protein